MSFIAKFDSECASCDTGIVEGEVIQFISGDEERNQYRSRLVEHVKCPDEPLTVTRPICPKCFTVKALNGKCGCE